MVDALIGAALALIGLGIIPIAVTENWMFILFGGIMFTSGAGVAVYNFSRLEE